MCGWASLQLHYFFSQQTEYGLFMACLWPKFMAKRYSLYLPILWISNLTLTAAFKLAKIFTIICQKWITPIMISQLVMSTQNPILHNLTSFHTLYKIINTWQICIFQGFSALWNTKCHKSLSEEAMNLLVRKTYWRNCSTGKQELSTGNRQVCYWSTQLILEVVSVNIGTMKKRGG